MHRRRLAGFVIATCVVAGCTRYCDPCFTPPSIVDDLRVLALSVDPPSPVADLATGTIEPVRVRALFGGTSGTIDVSWAICVPGSDPICPEEAIVARNPRWASDSSLDIRVPPDLVAAARAADPLRGAGGIRVLATLRVAGAVPEAASTPIVFVEPGQVRNRAPVLTGMPDPGSPEPVSGLIPLTAMGNGVLWVVARDSRGATSWLTVPVKVKAEDPRCAKGAFPPFFDCLYSNAIFGCL